MLLARIASRRVPKKHYPFECEATHIGLVRVALSPRRGSSANGDNPMHGTFERSRDTGDKNVYPGWGIGFLAIAASVAVTLAAMAIAQPAGSNWIAEAAQAEFTSDVTVPEAAPLQLARPARQIRHPEAH